MAVDYLSTLNVGSGLNTTQIVDALVNANRAPREEAINSKVTEKNVSISGFGQLKQNFETFKTDLTAMDGDIGLTTTSTASAIGLTISDINMAGVFDHTVTVGQLAQAHTLEIANSYTSETAATGQGTLLFEFGSWDNNSFTEDTSITNHTITIDSTNATLEGVRDAINAADMGVTASIVKTAEGAYSLSIKSTSGAGNEMKITATEDSSNTGLSAFDFSTYDADVETLAGLDATLTVDGISVTRSSNTITDLIDGIEMELTGTVTGARVSSAYNESTALEKMSAFVDSLNTLNTKLNELTKRDLTGGDDGDLAGDPVARMIKSKIRAYTTTPIVGYSDTEIYLANFGVTTNKDGTLSLNEDDFSTAYNAAPNDMMAVFQSAVTTDSSFITGSVTGTAYTPGVYEFSLANGAATIGGDSMTVSGTNYYTMSGDTNGLSLTTSLTSATHNIYVGRSLIDTLLSYTDTVLDTGSSVNERISSRQDELADLTDELASLDIKMQDMRERYVKQFSAMEGVVSSLKKTGDYLTNYTDSMRAARENG